MVSSIVNWLIDGTLIGTNTLDLGVMVIKEYSSFSKLELRHQIVLCHIQDTRLQDGEGVALLLYRDVSGFYSSSRLG